MKTGGGGVEFFSTFPNLKFEFLWIKQSKNVYEIILIFLYKWGFYLSTKSEDR